MRTDSIALTSRRGRSHGRNRELAARLSLLMAVVWLPSAAAREEPPAGARKPLPRLEQTVILRADPHNARTRVLPDPDVLLKTRPKTATFDVTYVDFPPAAQAAFQHAADIWAQLILSPVPIRVQANWTPLQPGTLGNALLGYYWDIDGYARLDALADAIRGFDHRPGVVDFEVNLNSDRDWYLGTDGNTPDDHHDLVSVALHEIGHGLGFFGTLVIDAGSGVGFWGLAIPDIYAAYAEDLAGTRLVDTLTYPNPSTQLADALQSGDVFFAGPRAMSAAGGARPELYAPAIWDGGSSLSHLDEAAYPAGDPDSLMTPRLSAAEAIHSPGEVALCMLQDLDWTTAADCQVGTSLSELADLIVPGFEVDVADPQGLTTLFAVRNTSASDLDIVISYHGEQVADAPLRTDVISLDPRQTATVNVGSDLTDLGASADLAAGLILIREPGASTGSLEGDYFRLDRTNAFASGDRLVDPQEDFCDLQEIRFVDFGNGSRLRILLDDPQGASQPSFTWTAYDEAGDLILEDAFFTSAHLASIDVSDLGFSNSFGTVVFDFSASGGGWASARYSAFGLYSVELNSACRDP